MFRKRFIFLFIVISVGLGLLWIEEYTTQSTGENVDESAMLPDYYGEGLTNKSFDKNGLLDSQFEAQRSVHFPNKKLAELTLPKFTTKADDGEVWIVKSLSGTHFEGEKRLFLQNDVVISPANPALLETNQNKFATILTEELTLFTETKIAQTDKYVEVIDFRSRINAVGMLLNIEQKRVEFLSQVNAKYEP